MTEQANFRDFTRKREPAGFTIGDESFECYKALAPKRMQRAIAAFRVAKAKFEGGVTEENIDSVIDEIVNVLKFFIKSEPFARFKELVDDEEADEPIDIMQLMEIVQYLIERIGTRPTEPSSDSLSTSETDDGGTSLTAGAQLAELTHSS